MNGKNIIVIIVVSFVGLSLAFVGGYFTGDRTFGELNRELMGSRQRVDELTKQYKEIARVNDSLRIRLESVLGGIRTANHLIDDISKEGRNAQETLRVTIENLGKVKAIIAGIAKL